jgi:serine/threonine protein phosphatase PrpC
MKAAYAIAKGTHRKNNEDSILFNGLVINGNADGIQTRHVSAQGVQVWAVADGMGGEKDGEFAARTAVSLLSESIESIVRADEPDGWDRPVFQYADHANTRIAELAAERGTRMGTTLALLVSGHCHAKAYGIGDSSVYLWRNGRLELLTARHTLADQLVRLKALTPEAARTDHRRSQLTRFLGMAEEDMIMTPDVSSPVSLKPGDLFLVCTDGLTSALTDSEIASALGSNCNPQELAHMLIDLTLKTGGADNISVVVAAAD